jgi:hypothetical protein
MLIVPPRKVMKRIASARLDGFDELHQIAEINLSQCEYLLNDWGETIRFSRKSTEQRVADLVGLVEALTDIARVPGDTTTYDSYCRKVPSNRDLSQGV